MREEGSNNSGPRGTKAAAICKPMPWAWTVAIATLLLISSCTTHADQRTKRHQRPLHIQRAALARKVDVESAPQALLNGTGTTSTRRLDGHQHSMDDLEVPVPITSDRVIVHCVYGEEEECLEQVKEFVHEEDDSIEIVHELLGTSFVAVKIPITKQESLKQLPAVFDIEEDVPRILVPTVESDDIPIEAASDQSAFFQIIPYGIDMVRAREVWSKYQTKGAGVRVCVIDSGLAPHQDINADNLLGGIDFTDEDDFTSDGNGHGTHVTGTIAAADNDINVVGVAPDVTLIILRSLDDQGRGFATDTMDAVLACASNGGEVINLSLGGNVSTVAEAETYQQVTSDGIVVVAAAGNSGLIEFLYPASYPSVISVANVDSFGNIASSSTRNIRMDVSAPGQYVLSLSNDGYSITTLSGTSMAAPHVSGLAALLKSIDPSATPFDIRRALSLTAIDRFVEGLDGVYGYGIVDGVQAADFLTGTYNQNGNCAPDEQLITVRLTTDDYPLETSWEIWQDDVALLRYMGFDPNSEVTINECIPTTGCLVFILRDTYGDGICCEDGAGSVEVELDGQLLFVDNFEDGEFTGAPFGPDCSQTTPPIPQPMPQPTARPTSTPTASPVVPPTLNPTSAPTASPMAPPTLNPTSTPTASPMAPPTLNPTSVPTASPVVPPTSNPTASPTLSPVSAPTSSPTTDENSELTFPPTTAPTVASEPTPVSNPTDEFVQIQLRLMTDAAASTDKTRFSLTNLAGESIWHQVETTPNRFYRQASILKAEECYTFTAQDDGGDGTEFLQVLHDGQIIIDIEYGNFGSIIQRKFGSLCE